MNCKCCIMIITLIVLCMDTAEAGSPGAHGGGLKAGILFSSPSGGDREEFEVEAINTFTFGVFHRYTISRALSIQTEGYYAHKGTKGHYYLTDGEVNIYYLDFDSVLQWRVLDREGPFAYLYLGPLFSMKMGASVKREESRSYNIDSYIKPYDFGYVIGGKIGLSKGVNEFAIDIRYASGLIAPDDTGNEIDLKNRTITVMFEMYFEK